MFFGTDSEWFVMPTFRSSKELKDYIIGKSYQAMQRAEEYVYSLIDLYLQNFYKDYNPVKYRRTDQLLHSLVKSDIRKSGNGWEAYVYFDFTSLKYETGKKPSGEQVISAAAKGEHGAEGLHTEQGKYGIDVWNEPVEIINSEFIEKFKEYLIDAGIPVK